MSIPAVMRRIHMMTGLSLQEDAVARAVSQRMCACGIAVRAEYATLALQQQVELDTLVELLVVPESWFFRDGDAFHAARQVARECIERRAGPVRILCLPCANGEEAYSMAMALHDSGFAPADFRIEGVDISSKAIKCAQDACYRANAFRTRDLAFRDRYVDAQGNVYRLRTEIRRLVEFRRGNLLDAAAADASYDIVFCRNLLIYFDEASQQAAIRKLKSLLAADGVLFVGYAEAATLLRDKEFESAPFPKAFALRRRQAAAKPDMQPLLAVPALPAVVRRASRTPEPASVPSPLPVTSAAQEAPSLEHARQLADRGSIEASLAVYREILARHPTCVEACFMLGLLSERRHEPQAAETYLRRAVYLDPDHYEALCHLALLADERGSAAVADALRQRAERVYRRRGSAAYRNDK